VEEIPLTRLPRKIHVPPPGPNGLRDALGARPRDPSGDEATSPATHPASRAVMTLALGFVVSLIGMAAFAYGKKTDRLVPVFGGVALMIYPYFVPSAIALAVIGAGLISAIIVLRDALD